MMISFMKRTIGLNEIKKETMPSVIKKAKDDACMVRADEDTIGDDEEYGDDDKLRDEILGVMEELCDTLNDSLNFKKVVCMGIKVSIAFKFLIFCSQSFRKNSDSKDLSFR
ncbi:hypothetical protein VN1280_01150 [Helicobacter pylori]|nr:hypothetical protein VN1280_01150 [Helicobacter pylori]